MPKDSHGGFGSRRGSGNVPGDTRGFANAYEYSSHGITFPSGLSLYLLRDVPGADIGMPGDWALVSTSQPCFEIYCKQQDDTWRQIESLCP